MRSPLLFIFRKRAFGVSLGVLIGRGSNRSQSYGQSQSQELGMDDSEGYPSQPSNPGGMDSWESLAPSAPSRAW
jgi:hypothetical protein